MEKELIDKIRGIRRELTYFKGTLVNEIIKKLNSYDGDKVQSIRNINGLDFRLYDEPLSYVKLEDEQLRFYNKNGYYCTIMDIDSIYDIVKLTEFFVLEC